MRDPGHIIAVYILASRRNGTLYTGVTSNLVQRAWQHRTGDGPGFAARYGCRTLVWFEAHERMTSAIAREKAIKTWRRSWKLALIEKTNPQWLDLGARWFDTPPSSPWVPGSSLREAPE